MYFWEYFSCDFHPGLFCPSLVWSDRSSKYCAETLLSRLPELPLYNCWAEGYNNSPPVIFLPRILMIVLFPPRIKIFGFLVWDHGISRFQSVIHWWAKVSVEKTNNRCIPERSPIVLQFACILKQSPIGFVLPSTKLKVQQLLWYRSLLNF